MSDRGDPLLFASYKAELAALQGHRPKCTKGCALEPPKRCTRGFTLRRRESDAWAAFEKTLPRPVFGRSPASPISPPGELQAGGTTLSESVESRIADRGPDRS